VRLPRRPPDRPGGGSRAPRTGLISASARSRSRSGQRPSAAPRLPVRYLRRINSIPCRRSDVSSTEFLEDNPSGCVGPCRPLPTGVVLVGLDCHWLQSRANGALARPSGCPAGRSPAPSSRPHSSEFRDACRGIRVERRTPRQRSRNWLRGSCPWSAAVGRRPGRPGTLRSGQERPAYKPGAAGRGRRRPAATTIRRSATAVRETESNSPEPESNEGNA